MILDLGPLPYRYAVEIIKWCFEHHVDTEKCILLIRAMSESPAPKVEWTIDVPEKYITYFLLKWPEYNQATND